MHRLVSLLNTQGCRVGDRHGWRKYWRQAPWGKRRSCFQCIAHRTGRRVARWWAMPTLRRAAGLFRQTAPPLGKGGTVGCAGVIPVLH